MFVFLKDRFRNTISIFSINNFLYNQDHTLLSIITERLLSAMYCFILLHSYCCSISLSPVSAIANLESVLQVKYTLSFIHLHDIDGITFFALNDSFHWLLSTHKTSTCFSLWRIGTFLVNHSCLFYIVNILWIPK
jgi:hypothetical protein